MGASVQTTTRDILISIKEKQDRMNDDIKEIKTTVKGLDESQRNFAVTYAEEHERVVNAASLAHKRIDEVLIWKYETEKRIKAIEEALVAQKAMNRVLVFIATIIGSAAIMYIWNVIIQ